MSRPAQRMMAGLLKIENLKIVFTSRGEQPVFALDGVSLDVAAGEVTGVLGPSGSGKTTLGLSVISLLPENAQAWGSIRYRGRELIGLTERQLERIRGAEISMVFQEPALALHPALCVGEQVADVIRAHSKCSRRQSRELTELAMAQVCLKPVRRILAAYPHELSGGERQRVVIARALASRPSLLIADEPTGSLDSTVQAEILGLLGELNQCLGLAILLISHSPAVLAKLASRVVVLSSGRVVEQGKFCDLLEKPAHPYMRLLTQQIPQWLN